MMRAMMMLAAVAMAAVAGSATGAVAQSKTTAAGEHPQSKTYRAGKPQVRGFVQRRGGYSYSASDTINTTSDGRSMFGGANSYRDSMLDRQTRFGPFDHGFFFDSGISPRGGNSPYPN